MVDDTAGGYAYIARILSDLADHTITRQGVWQWWSRRDRNGFPEGSLIPSGSGRTSHRVFGQDEVISWWKEHYQTAESVFTSVAESGNIG